MKMNPRGKIYSINEGYYKYFDQATKDYIESVKNPKVWELEIPGLHNFIFGVVSFENFCSDLK